MQKRIFIIKVLRYIAIILSLLSLLVAVIKKWHLSLWLKCPHNFNWGRHSTNQNWMFPFFILCKFSCLHTNNTTNHIILQYPHTNLVLYDFLYSSICSIIFFLNSLINLLVKILSSFSSTICSFSVISSSNLCFHLRERVPFHHIELPL